MFRFLNAIRNRGPVEEIESLRLKSVAEFEMEQGGGNIYPPLEALRFSVMYSHLDYARYILRTYGETVLKVSLCCPLLLLAVRLNDEAMLKLLCEESAQIDVKSKINYVNARGCELMENGKTALHTAAELGYVNCTRILLQYGADPYLKDSTRLTPIEKAAQKYLASLNNLRCCIELLKCGKQLQPEFLPVLTALHNRVHVDYICDICDQLPKKVEPSRLEHLCRCEIRGNLGSNILKSAEVLPLPSLVKYSISLESSDKQNDGIVKCTQFTDY